MSASLSTLASDLTPGTASAGNDVSTSAIFGNKCNFQNDVQVSVDALQSMQLSPAAAIPHPSLA